MTTLRSSRTIAVLLLITLWPALGLAQSAPPAGVVTGLQGTARLVRPVIAQPIPLKFKDDLFLRDQVETRENSVVRVLLGGKALVTVRELSTFTITEEPGRAAIDLKSGKIAVGVAKSLLKPGEAIEIRTPNAIAAVRGSLLIASVVISGGVPQSSFIALDASLPITVTPLGGSAAAAVALNANQAVGVSGIGASTAVGPVQNITPDVARREAQTTAAPRAADGQGASSPMAAQISVAKAQEAVMLASLIAPAAAGATPPPADATLASATQTQLLQEPGSTLTTASQTASSSIPPPPSTGSLGVNAGATETAISENTPTAPDGGTSPPVEPPPVVPPPVVPPPGGPVVISNQNLALAADQTLKTYSGQSASTDTTAAVTVTNSTVTGAGNLIVVEPGANASLVGPLLDVTGPTATPAGLTASSSVVDIRGVLSSTTTGSFISIDPTLVITTDFLRIVGGSLNLAGSLLTDVQGIYVVSGDFLSVQQGGTLTASGASPLLQFSNSVVGLGIVGSETPSRLLTLGGPGSAATLGGSLASLTNSSGLVINGAAGSALVAIAPGESLTSPSASPMVDLASGSLLSLGTGVRGFLGTGGTASIGGSFLRVAASNILADLNVPIIDLTNTAVDITGFLVRLEGGSLLLSGGVKVTGGSLAADTLVSTDGLGNALAIGGTALDLTNTTVTLGALAREPVGSTDTVAVNLGLNQAALRLSSSALTLTDVNDTVLGLGADVGPVPTIPGVGVIAGGTPAAPSTLNLKGTLLELSRLNATATQPMVQLDQTTVNQTETVNALISILVPTGSTSTMAGPLLSVTNSAINTSGILAHLSGGVLTSSTTTPFLFVDPSSVTSGRQIVLLDQGFSLGLTGPLFAAVNTNIQTGGPTLAASFLNIFDGASVTSSSTTPLLSFDGSSVDTAGSLLSVRRSASLGSRSRLTLAGPLFLATNGSIFDTTSPAFGPTFGVAGRPCCSLVTITQGGQLTSTTTAPLIRLIGSTINAGPDLQSGGSIVGLSDTAAGFPATELVAPSSVSLSGPLLRAEGGSTISALNHLLSLGRSSLTSTSPAALIQIADSSVSLGGLDPFTNTIVDGRLVTLFGPTTFPTTVTLQGPLFSAVNSTLTTTGAMVGVFDGATLTSTSPDPLISISGSLAQAAVSGQGDNFIAVASSLGLPPTVTLGGPLLAATNSTLLNGDGASNIFSFLFIGDSSTVTSTATAPLLAFDNVNLDSAATILSLRRSLSTVTPSRLTLAGPLFSAVNGSIFNTTSLGLGSACCDGFGVRQAAELTSTTTEPLIQLTGSTFNAGPDAQSGGNFFGISDNSIDGPVTAPAKVNLAGPLLSASGNSSITALFSLLSIARSNFASTATGPLIQLNNSTVSLGGLDPFTNATSAARLLNLSGTVAVPGTLTLQGPLFSSVASNVTTTAEPFGIFAGGSLTQTETLAPLILLSGGTVASSGAGGHFIHARGFATGGSIPASLSLSGPLLTMSGTAMNITGNLLRLADGGSLSSTTGSPLIGLTGGTFTGPPAGSILGGSLLRMFSQGGQSGTSLSLTGPYLVSAGTVYNAMDTNAFNIADGAVINSTSTQPFASMSGGSTTVGGNVIGLAAETSFTTPGQPTTVGSGVPPTMNLAGPLLNATDTSFASPFNLLSIFRAGMTAGSADPLIQLDAATVSLGGVNPVGGAPTFGRVFVLQASGTSGTADSPASLSLTGAGPLLLATNSSISTSSDVVGIFNGGTFASATTAPVIQLNGGTVTTQSAGGFGGSLLLAGGTGGPTGSAFASAQLAGGLLSATGALNLSGGLVSVFSGGQVTSTGSTNPFVLLNGGTHVIAGNLNPGSMFSLSGRSAATALDAESQLLLGTDRPIQGALQLDGTRPMLTSLLETSGATVTGQKVLRMDNALLEATAPLLNLRANGATQSVLNTTGTNAVDLSFRAQVSALGGSLIRLDNSVLNVANGSLVNVNASKLTVGGDLISLLNGAKLTLGAGSLLSVQSGGFASIGGALVSFGGTGGNAITVNNGLVPTGFINGIPVFSSLGGTTGFSITNSTPLVGLNTLGTITINGAPLPSNATAASGITGSLIGIQGTGGQVKIGLQ